MGVILEYECMGVPLARGKEVPDGIPLGGQLKAVFSELSERQRSCRLSSLFRFSKKCEESETNGELEKAKCLLAITMN